MREEEMTMEGATLFPTHFLRLDPGLVAMKARTTMMVFANMEDTAAEKMMPKRGCRRRQESFPGFSRNSKEVRKQSSRETRSM